VPSIALFMACAAGACGCTYLATNSPLVQDKLKLVSAGYTGCMPEENALSNIKANPDESGTWNAACKGKMYLCSAVSTIDSSVSYHCALVSQ